MMRKIIALCVALFAAPALAKPANTECVASDGTRFYMVANNGQVMVQFEGGNWNEAFSKVENKTVLVTIIAPNGLIVIAWDTNDNSAYVILKNDKTGQKLEKHARCWFK